MSTRVFPDPAPATTATNVDSVVTARRWSSSRSTSRSRASTPPRYRGPPRPSSRVAVPTREHGCPSQYCWLMPYPKKLLNDYETVALDLHPHWWSFSEPAAALVGSVIFGIVVRWKLDGDTEKYLSWLAIALILGCAVWLVVRYLKWSTTNFVITSDRIIFRSGIIAKSGIEIPLERVNNVLFSQSIFERILGAGDLLIESGGEDGQQRFTDVRHPERVQNLIHSQMESNENRRFGGMSTGGARRRDATREARRAARSRCDLARGVRRSKAQTSRLTRDERHAPRVSHSRHAACPAVLRDRTRIRHLRRPVRSARSARHGVHGTDDRVGRAVLPGDRRQRPVRDPLRQSRLRFVDQAPRPHGGRRAR